jgi:hypothetical protein
MPTDYFKITENQVNITINYPTIINIIGTAESQKFKGTKLFLSGENEGFFSVCYVTAFSEKVWTKINSKSLLM